MSTAIVSSNQDAAGMLDAIRAAPDDDLPRLAYADWLDENGQPERAEFVRLQVKIARLEAASGHPKRSPLAWSCKCAVCDEAKPLWERAGVLLDAPGAMDGTENGAVWASWPRGFVPAAHGFRRGFVEKIRCPLAAWQQYGPAIVRAHPVTRVELTDRRPSSHYRPPLGDWYWVCRHGDTGHLADRLPPALYATLPEGAGEDPDGVMTYATESLARDALSAALVAWANVPDAERGTP